MLRINDDLDMNGEDKVPQSSFQRCFRALTFPYFSSSHFFQFLETIGCHPACRRPTHDIKVEYVLDTNEDDPGSNQTAETGSLFLNLYIPLSKLTVREEFLVYDLAGLAGDMGGMVGMLLGASVLGLYDWAGRIMAKMATTCGFKSSAR